MVRKQLPSAISHFSPKLKRALVTQSKWVNGRLHHVQPLLHAVRPNSARLTPGPVRETPEDIPVRPQLPRGAVFAC